MNAIEFKNLTFSYIQGTKILDNISLSIKRGSFVSLLGSNGSGKTTIAKLIVGLLKAQEGEIFVGGALLEKKNLDEIRKKTVIVFQNPDNQFIGATVEDDIAFGLENRQIPHEQMDKIIKKYSTLVGMNEFLDKEPVFLSGGQKQRVAIAGALALKPDIIIFDESTAMLDPIGKEEIHNIIQNMREVMPDLTILSISHDMEEVLISDRVIYLDKGKIIFDDVPDKFFSNVKFLEQHQIRPPFLYELKQKLLENNISHKGESLEEVIKYAYQNK